jgi:hypothetical protein
MELHARISHLARPATLSVALGALLALFAGTVTADAKSKRYPVVTSVSPMNAKVGDTITIRGRNFVRGKNKNSVVFKRQGGRAIFVKQTLGTAKQIRVVVPETLRKYLTEGVAARVQLRILAQRFGKNFTSVAKSPRITAEPLPIDGSKGTTGTGSTGSTGSTGPGTPAPPRPVCTGDDDGDWLPASLENDLGLDACNPDTDGDGVPDGYEYQAARDLNDDEYQEVNTSLPYPGERPYPNALFSDAGVDYDGDGLPLGAEYKLQKAYGTAPAGLLPRDDFRLSYSDGEQYSLSTREAGTGRRTPSQSAAGYGKAAEFLAWASSGGYNPVYITKTGPWYDTASRVAYDLRDASLNGVVEASEQSLADRDGDTWISDDERDEDADGLSNLDELRGAMTAEFWTKCYAASGESAFPVTYAGTDPTKADSDGDGIRDGADDQDHDDLPNVMELSRFEASGGFVDWHSRKGKCFVEEGLLNGPDTDGDGTPNPVVRHLDSEYGRVNPFNPCLPFRFARTCPGGAEFGVKYAPYDDSPWYSLQ